MKCVQLPEKVENLPGDKHKHKELKFSASVRVKVWIYKETQLIKSLCANKGVRSEVKLNMAKNIVVKRVIDEQSPN